MGKRFSIEQDKIASSLHLSAHYSYRKQHQRQAELARQLRGPSPANADLETGPADPEEPAGEEQCFEESPGLAKKVHFPPKDATDREKKQKTVNLVNMPPPETLLTLRRHAKDRYGREDDEYDGNLYIHGPKERLNMAKLYRNQILKGIKRDKDKNKLNQDLVMVKTDPGSKEDREGSKEEAVPVEVSPVQVTPRKFADDRRKSTAAVQAEARAALGHQIVMPPCVSVVPKMVNKNNLIGLHRAKRHWKQHPKSPPALAFAKEPICVDTRTKDAMN